MAIYIPVSSMSESWGNKMRLQIAAALSPGQSLGVNWCELCTPHSYSSLRFSQRPKQKYGLSETPSYSGRGRTYSRIEYLLLDKIEHIHQYMYVAD